MSDDRHLPLSTAAEIRAALPEVATQVIASIVEEVPSYADAFAGPMGAVIREAVEDALGGFLSLATRGPMGGPLPRPPAVDGAYQLGRGEARSGRSTDAILSAYRIGARVSWREMSRIAVDEGLDAGVVTDFAALVFAYIDELSAASVAGHGDELATSGRLRERLLERLTRRLVDGEDPERIVEAADRAEYPHPETMLAVLLPGSQARAATSVLPAQSLRTGSDEVDDSILILVPDLGVAAVERSLPESALGRAVLGPAVPWTEVGRSVQRVVRAARLGLLGRTETHLATLALSADPATVADLRRRVLAPLEPVRPATRDKLAETLHAWVLHLGSRERVAEALHVHPQTVRYRMGQLRDLYGDHLEDPRFVAEVVIALAAPDVSSTP